MQYLGGKSRTRNEIAGYLNWLRAEMAKERGTAVPYWEPFVGAGWVLEKIKGQPIYASDANGALIALWRAVQKGWQPPTVVTEEDYQRAKDGLMTAYETAFIGFGVSHSGRWFGGYAKPNPAEGHSNYAETAHVSLLTKINKSDNVTFFTADFLTCYIPAYGCLIYCDPPYAGTAGYKGLPKFNSKAFWQRVRWLENNGHTVVVSEYAAPDDFSCVLEMPTLTDVATKNGKRERRTERLFRYGQHANVKPKLFNF